MPTLKLAPLALLLMTSTAVAGNPTDATCWLDNLSSRPPGSPFFRRWPDSTTQINVLVDTSTTPDRFGRFLGVQDAFYNPYFVAKATEIAVERINEQAGIPQRLVFAGFKTDSPDIPPPPDTVVIQGGGCIEPNESGNAVLASGGCEIGETGFCTTGGITLFEAAQGKCDVHYADMYANANVNQGLFVDVLVHELGHTLGRSDAYKTACGLSNQNTIMESLAFQEMTNFDRTEMQAVYGTRAASNVVQRRMLQSTTSAWGATTNLGITFVDVAPGPGSSFGHTSIPVSTLRFINTVTQISFRSLSSTGSLGSEALLTGSLPTKKPVSTSFSPTGTGVMAYIVETGGNDSERVLCIRKKASATAAWGTEVCSNPCPSRVLPNNEVSTAFDNATGRFLVAHACEQSQLRISALATSVDCNAVRCSEVNVFPSIAAAETPVIACDPWGQAGSNCRLVYARRNVVGQKIAWRTFGVVLGFTSNQITIGNEVPTDIESEHAPAVTYYGDAFQMALTRSGTLLQTYWMYPSYSGTGPGWTFDITLNTTGWISPPFYSSSQQCRFVNGNVVCTDQLHLLWVKYR